MKNKSNISSFLAGQCSHVIPLENIFSVWPDMPEIFFLLARNGLKSKLQRISAEIHFAVTFGP